MTSITKPTLILKKVETLPITVNINLPPERPKIRGHVIAHAIVRNREAIDKLRNDIMDSEKPDDGAVLRMMYTKIEGLGNAAGELLEGEDAFKEIMEGEWNTYLPQAFMDAYFEHFHEARAKNFGGSRGR